MRIIGGHDYYDGAVPFDADNSRVFVRDGKESDFTPVEKWEPVVQRYLDDDYECTLTSVEVIFCGKRYRGMKLSRRHKNTYLPNNRYLWSQAALSAYVELRSREKWQIDRIDHNVYADDIERYFTPGPVSIETFNLLLTNRVLIALYEAEDYGQRRKWIINSDDLKRISFPSVFSSWEAYQELEMFLGTILVGDADRMVKVSDETKVSKYGFDKWSFRNQVHPGKPRHR